MRIASSIVILPCEILEVIRAGVVNETIVGAWCQWHAIQKHQLPGGLHIYGALLYVTWYNRHQEHMFPILQESNIIKTEFMSQISSLFTCIVELCLVQREINSNLLWTINRDLLNTNTECCRIFATLIWAKHINFKVWLWSSGLYNICESLLKCLTLQPACEERGRDTWYIWFIGTYW